MFVTELVFHPEISALNDDAPENTELPAGNHADAPENIPPMFVTELVSHPEMSALNDDAS